MMLNLLPHSVLLVEEPVEKPREVERKGGEPPSSTSAPPGYSKVVLDESSSSRPVA